MPSAALQQVTPGSSQYWLSGTIIDLQDYHNMIMNAARKFVNMHPDIYQDADDLYQEGVCAFIEKGGDYNGSTQIATWIFRICWWHWLRLTYKEIHNNPITYTSENKDMISNELLSSQQISMYSYLLGEDAWKLLEVLMSLPRALVDLAESHPNTWLPKLAAKYLDIQGRQKAKRLNASFGACTVYHKRWYPDKVREVTNEIRSFLEICS